jgi:competence protein ComEA
LAQLPGVGKTLAQRIVSSRDQDGPFVDHSELRRIRGIGPKTLEKMKSYLRPIPPAGNVAGKKLRPSDS